MDLSADALILALAVLSLSCGSQPCQKSMQSLLSPDGKYVAEVSLDGFCGGAATRSSTYIEVRSTRFRFIGDQVAWYRGAAAVRMKWLSSQKLQVAVRLKAGQFVKDRDTRWRDIEFAFDEQRVPDNDPVFSTPSYENTLGF